MSQDKVDRYKKEKANRKKIVKKQKRNSILSKVAVVFVTLICIGWIITSSFKIWPFDGSLDPTTTTESKSYSADEIASLQNVLGTTTTAEGATTSANDATTTAAEGATTEAATTSK